MGVNISFEEATSRLLSTDEVRRLGLVQEINRRFLHPLGYMLIVAVYPPGSGKTDGLFGIIDFTDDPDGVAFDEGVIHPGVAQLIDQEWEKRLQPRQKALGHMVQPTSSGTADISERVLRWGRTWRHAGRPWTIGEMCHILTRDWDEVAPVVAQLVKDGAIEEVSVALYQVLDD